MSIWRLYSRCQRISDDRESPDVWICMPENSRYMNSSWGSHRRIIDMFLSVSARASSSTNSANGVLPHGWSLSHGNARRSFFNILFCSELGASSRYKSQWISVGDVDGTVGGEAELQFLGASAGLLLIGLEVLPPFLGAGDGPVGPFPHRGGSDAVHPFPVISQFLFRLVLDATIRQEVVDRQQGRRQPSVDASGRHRHPQLVRQPVRRDRRREPRRVVRA